MTATESHAGANGLERGILAIASVVVIGAIMSILDATIVNVALATLSRDLHRGPATARAQAGAAQTA